MIVVISGGAGAIGRALAQSFLRDGAQVHLFDRASNVVEVAAEIGAHGHVCDVTDEAALAARPRFDRVDVLVNGVGSWLRRSVDELDRQLWDTLITVNLTSAFTLTRHLLEPLRRARGTVVNLTSAIALKGHAELIPYAAAKAGLVGLTRSLARALGPDGIRVNAVAPGLVRTAYNDELWDGGMYAGARAGRALPRDQTPDDIVGVVRFLSAPSSGFVTGQTIVVDGGTVMQ